MAKVKKHAPKKKQPVAKRAPAKRAPAKHAPTKRPAPKSAKGVTFDLDAFAAKNSLTISARYRQFVEGNEGASHKDRFVADVPGWSADAKLKVAFLAKPSFAIFEENGVDRDESPQLVPLCTIAREPDFFATDVSHANCPVSYWDHESGMFEVVASSLDAFLAGLLKKGDKLPIELARDAAKKADAAVKAKRWAAALEALGELPVILAGKRLDSPLGSTATDVAAALFNTQGRALEGLGRIDEALAAFARASTLGASAAMLNAMSIHLDRDEPDAAIALGKDGIVDSDDEVYWIERYLADAYLRTNKVAEAESELRAMLDKFSVSDEARITEMRAWLEERAASGTRGAATAKEFLRWFKVLKAESLSDAERAELRAWWDDAPKHGDYWQPLLREGVGLKGKKPPTDDELLRMRAIRRLEITSEKGVIDLTPATPLRRVKTVKLKGDVRTLEPLRGLPSDATIDVNGETIRYLRLPNRADVALLAAAEAGDEKRINEALDAGANPNAKDRFAKSALHRVMGNFAISAKSKEKLALHLIARGADLYVDDDHDATPLEDQDEALVRKVEAAYAKTGRKPAESPYRVWVETRFSIGCGIARFKLDGSGPDGRPKPGASLVARMDTGYPGAKKDTRILDFRELPNYDRVGKVLVSARMRDFLVAGGHAHGIEFLPVTVLDHAKKRVSGEYFLLFVPQYDCLDEEKSQPMYRWDEDFNGVRRLVLDEAKVPKEPRAFRIKHYGDPLMIKPALATALTKALETNALEGFSLRPPRR